MKIIDNNGRLFGKISIIDVVVLLLAVVLAAALYMKTHTMTHTSTETVYDTITFTYFCPGMPEFVKDGLRVGDKLFDADNLAVGSLGEIVDIQYLPGTEYKKSDAGIAGYFPADECVDVLVTVRGQGIITGDTYQINRIYPIGINANRNYCTPYVMLKGTVASVGK